MKAALYIRVSTVEQLSGYSLDAQEELLRNYAKEHGMEVYGLYADRGKSANKALHRREELLRMVKDAESNKFDCILFKDITRWSRNSSHYWMIQDRLEKCGVYWIAVEQPYLETKTPTGRFQVTIMLGTAQLESENTSQRIRFVKEHIASIGGVVAGKTPFGYKIATVDGMKRLVKDPEKMHIVNDIFDFYFHSRSQLATVRYLESKYGIRTTDSTICRMMHNPIYKGQYRDNTDYCEPYLAESEWNMMQNIRPQYKQSRSNPKRLFKGLIRCPECGKMMTPKYNGMSVQYVCFNGVTGTMGCHYHKYLNQNKIEQTILNQIGKLLDGTVIYEVPYIDQKRNAPDVSSQIKKLETKLKNLKELYIEADIDKATYTDRKRTITAEIDRLKNEPTNSIPVILTQNNASWRDQYNAKSPQEQAEWFRFVLKRIDVVDDGFVAVFRNYAQQSN